MKFFAFLLLFVLFHSPYFLQAQNSGSIEYHADPRIDVLIKKQGSVTSGASAPQLSGYRVQLAFDTDRKTIDEARNRFSASFPNVETYVMFNAPNFFLKAGDFRTQLEAEKLKDSVTSDFPTSFILKEQINLPKIDQP